MRLLLKPHGYLVETFAGPAELLEAELRASLILVDMNYTRDTTSGAEGLELIGQLRARKVKAPVLAMTAWGDISLAVAAMQTGASDFLEKPWSNERMVQVVAKWVAAGQREAKEMDRARDVQRNLLPRQRGAEHGFRFACRFLPAREVSGDYYDFFELSEGRFAFVVADVSGKGIPAAMLMANLQALFRSHAGALGGEPAALLGQVNRYFHESTPPEAFATAFYGIYDERTRRLTYLSCGHPAGLVRRGNGKMEELLPQATVLGAFAAWRGEAAEVQLEEGDRLLVVSDGVVEAQRGEEEFGEERLRATLERTAGAEPAEALEAMEREIVRFSGPVLFDDCTLFLVAI